MATMNAKNMQLSPAAADLGLGDALKVQVDDQVADQQKKLRQQKGIQMTVPQAAMDLGLGR